MYDYICYTFPDSLNAVSFGQDNLSTVGIYYIGTDLSSALKK